MRVKDGRRENKVRASQVVRLMEPDEFLWEKKDAHVPGLCPCRDGGSNHRDREGWTERVRVANEEGEIPQGKDGGLCQSGAGWSYQVLRADVLLV